jgi:hypothetical protein
MTAKGAESPPAGMKTLPNKLATRPAPLAPPAPPLSTLHHSPHRNSPPAHNIGIEQEAPHEVHLSADKNAPCGILSDGHNSKRIRP